MKRVNITFTGEHPLQNKTVELNIASGANGIDGAPGVNGRDGMDGKNGADGKSATITIGSVTTGEPGTQAVVTNSGTENAAVLDFVIPRGADGSDGTSGEELASKADLDPATGWIVPQQIAPLHGRQSGACTSNGYFLSDAAPLRRNESVSAAVTFITGSQLGTATEHIIAQSDTDKGLRLTLDSGRILQCYMGQHGFRFSGLNIAAQTTYHIVITYDKAAGQLKGYVNGSLTDTLDASQPGNVPEYLCLGSRNGNGSCTHTVCDLRMFNHPLTQEDITTLWNQGKPWEYVIPADKKGAGENKCTAEYIACGLLPDKWRDTSGNGHHLNAVGTPSYSYAIPAYNDPKIAESSLGILSVPQSATALRNNLTIKNAVENIGSQLNALGNGWGIASWKEPSYSQQGIQIGSAAYCELEFDSTGLGRYTYSGTYTGNIPVYREASTLPYEIFGNTTYTATLTSAPTLQLVKYNESGSLMFNTGDTAILSLKGAYTPVFESYEGRSIDYEAGYSSVVPTASGKCVYRITWDGTGFLVSRSLYGSLQ